MDVFCVEGKIRKNKLNDLAGEITRMILLIECAMLIKDSQSNASQTYRKNRIVGVG